MLMIFLWLAACAWVDAREQRVPNALTLPLIGLALLQLAVYQLTLSGAPASAGFIAAGLALALTLPGFILGRLGGGDVKLLVALGLGSAPGVVLGSFVYGSVALALWAMARAVVVSAPSPTARPASEQASVPAAEMAFAPSLLIGALINSVWPLQAGISALLS